MKNHPYTVITRLAPWGDQSRMTFFTWKKMSGPSINNICKQQDEFCEQWNRTHGQEQQAWISGSVYLEWPGRIAYEKLFDISEFINNPKLVNGVYVKFNVNKMIGDEELEFEKIRGRRAWIAEHPEDK